MKKLMIVAAVAASMSAFGTDWFSETAASTSANWNPAPAVENSKLVIADSNAGTVYTPAAVEGTLDTSEIVFADVNFQAEQDELPSVDGAKAGITIYNGKFYVIDDGAWVNSNVAADPTQDYTITCVFDYTNGKVAYKNGSSILYDNAVSSAFTTINFQGDAELTSLVGTYDLVAAVEDWNNPIVTPSEAANAAAAWPSLAGGAFANANAAKLQAWATANSIDFADAVAGSVNVDAFLLNCAPSAVESAKANFRITSFEYVEGVWVVTVAGSYADGDGYGNGYINVVEAEITGAATGSEFKKAILSLQPVLK